MKVILSIICLLISTATLADQGYCEHENSTNTMRECYSLLLKKNELKLETLVSSISKQLANYTGSEESKKFMELHKDWKTWSDNLCSNQRTLFGRGSLAGISFINCKLKLVTTQEEILRDLYINSINID